MTASDSSIEFRHAEPADAASITQLIASAELPAWHVEEYLKGFIVATHGGEIVACGGLEPYEYCGVLRSIVVAETMRGSGLGRELVARLEADAAPSGIRELYLFTTGAERFFERLGYVQTTMAAWSEPPRACWQYVYVAAHRPEFDAMGLRTLRKDIDLPT